MSSIELRFQANADHVNQIGDFFNQQRGSDVGRTSLNFMSWAVQEMQQGRQIQAVGESGDIHVPVLVFNAE